ncbi:MAG TPA: hypothetical protein VEJ63_07475 [Planctomycetota bacterium]|nr:hypothetical protein [Planctomycetota bacterium]
MVPGFASEQGGVNFQLIVPATVSYGWPYEAVTNKAWLWKPQLVENAAKAAGTDTTTLMKNWVRQAYADRNVKDASYHQDVGFLMIVHRDVVVDNKRVVFNIAIGAFILLMLGLSLEFALHRRR